MADCDCLFPFYAELQKPLLLPLLAGGERMLNSVSLGPNQWWTLAWIFHRFSDRMNAAHSCICVLVKVLRMFIAGAFRKLINTEMYL